MQKVSGGKDGGGRLKTDDFEMDEIRLAQVLLFRGECDVRVWDLENTGHILVWSSMCFNF